MPGGKQMYKVKWEPTWEPAENLISCKHLIDKFWSFINHAKNNEMKAEKHGKRPRMDTGIIEEYRLSEDSKSEVQKLIARTNSTQVGSGVPLMSPSNILQQNNNLSSPQPAANNIQRNSMNTPQLQNFSPQQQRGKPPANIVNKSPAIKMDGTGDDARSHLKKVNSGNNTENVSANWSNPYVTVHFKCRVCQKELPKPDYWKRHHSFHEAPKHVCSICGKSFIQACDLKRHGKTHKSTPNDRSDGGSSVNTLKTETKFSVKQEIDLTPY